MADTAFDLSGKLGFDTSKLQASINNAVGYFGKLQTTLTNLGASQKDSGLGVVIRALAGIEALSKKAFGGESLSSVNTYKRSVDSLNKSLNTTLQLYKEIRAATKSAGKPPAGGSGGLGGIVDKADAIATAMHAIGDVTTRALGVEGVKAVTLYGASIDKLNVSLAETLRLTSGIGKLPIVPTGKPGAGGGSGSALGSLSGAASSIGAALQRAFSIGSQAASSFAENARRSFAVAAGGLKQIATAAGATGAALAILTIGGLKFGASYEQAMARVKAVTQATQAEFSQLDATAKQLGIDTVYSAKDAAEGMSFLAMGGYKVNQIIGAMPSVMSLAAVAQVDVGNASRILVNVMESMRLHVDELPHSIDVFARALTLGGNDITEFGEAFKYVGPVAKAAGYSLEEVAATIQLLGKQGINASMAGTSLRGILTYLAQDGKKLKKTFDDLGVSVYDSQGKLRHLPDIIDALNAGLSRTGRQSESLKVVMDSVSQRAGVSFQALLTLQGDAIRDAMAKLKDSAGYAVKIAETQQSTLGNRFKQVLESVSTFGISLTNHVSPGLQKLLLQVNDWMGANKGMIEGTITAAWDKFSAIVVGTKDAFVEMYRVAAPVLSDLYDKGVGLYQSFMQWFGSLPEGTQNALKVAAAMTVLGTGLSQIGGMIPFVGQFATAIGNLLNPVKAMSGAFALVLPLIGAGGSVVTALLSLSASLLGLVVAGGPIALVIAAIAGAAGLLFILGSDGGLEGALNSVGGTLKGSFVEAFDAAQNAVAAFTAYLKGDSLTAIGNVHVAIGKLAGAVGLNGLAAQLKAMGEGEIQEATLGPQLREKRTDKYGAKGADLMEMQDRAEKTLLEASDRLKETEAERKKFAGPLGKLLTPNLDTSIESQKASIRELRMQNADAKSRVQKYLESPEGLQAQRSAQADAAYKKSLVNDASVKKYKDQLNEKNLGKGAANPGGGVNQQEVAQDETVRAQARQQYNQQNAAQVASAGAAVANAAPSSGGASALTGPIGSDAMAPAMAKAYGSVLGLAFSTTDKGGKGGQGVKDFVQTGQGDIAKALKPDKEGVVDADAARKIATNYRDVLAQMDGVSQEGVQKWYAGMIAKINLVKTAPDGLADFFTEALDKADVKLTQLLDKTGKFKPDVVAEQVKSAEHKKAADEEQKKVAGAALDQNIKEGLDSLGMTTDENGKPVKDIKQQQLAQNQLAKQGSVYAKSAMKNIRANAPDANSAQDKQGNTQALAFLDQYVQKLATTMDQAQQLTGKEQQDQLAAGAKLKTAIDAMAKAFEGGERDVKKLADAAAKAGGDMDKLDQAEKDKLAQANGQPTAAQQQLMQQQQQMAQQIQQGMMNAANQAIQQQGQAMFEGGQQMLQQALNGPGQVQALIDEAASKGDMKSAYALIRQRLEEQLKVSMSNLHNLASDPMAGGGFGPEQGGVSNDAYFMTLDIPLVRLIKFLQAQLNNLPKMASGGIATHATTALVGEAGPEAIIPLNKAGQFMSTMFGQPMANMFGQTGGAMLSMFDNTFRNASYYLSTLMDRNVAGASAMMDRWNIVQTNASDALQNLYRYRQINTQPGLVGGGGAYFDPNHRMIGSPAGYSGGNFAINGMHGVTINFHGVNFNNPSQVRQAANQLYQHLSDTARARGKDMSGRDPLRSPANFGATIVNSPTALRR